MSAHTPGPWEALTDYPQCVVASNLVGRTVRVATINDLHYAGHDDPNRAPANARLIAAAPDLLAAVAETTTALLSACMVITDDEARKIVLGIVKDARAALAKARGES